MSDPLCCLRASHSTVRVIAESMSKIQRDAASIEWTKVFKTSFMLLFIAYPGALRVDRHRATACMLCVVMLSCDVVLFSAEGNLYSASMGVIALT